MRVAEEVAAILRERARSSRDARGIVDAVGDAGAFEQRLAALLDEGSRAWPTIPIEPEAVADVLLKSMSEGVTLMDHLEAVGGRDLVLVAGCCAGAEPALLEFEAGYLRRGLDRLRQMGVAEHEVDEVAQRVRERLLLRAGDGVPLARYVGKGSLEAFVKVVVTRAGIDRIRQLKVQAPVDSPDAGVPSVADSPELRVLKGRHSSAFKQAFEDAVQTLDPRDKTLLRMSIVERLNIDEVGALYGVHRSTASRWIAKARALLADQTREALRRQLRLSDEEFDSFARWVDSQLDLSVSRVLGERSPEP